MLDFILMYYGNNSCKQVISEQIDKYYELLVLVI